MFNSFESNGIAVKSSIEINVLSLSKYIYIDPFNDSIFTIFSIMKDHRQSSDSPPRQIPFVNMRESRGRVLPSG